MSSSICASRKAVKCHFYPLWNTSMCFNYTLLICLPWLAVNNFITWFSATFLPQYRSCIICFSERYICFMNPCHNGGICVENPLAPCLCPNGYVGKYCIGKNFFLLQWSYTISYISKGKNMLIWNTSFLPKITCVDQIHACTKALAK